MVSFLFFIPGDLKSQEKEPSIVTAVNYFNTFQKYRYTDSDSATYYIQKLAQFPEHEDLLIDLIHAQFALSFYIPPNQSCGYTRNERVIAMRILSKLLKDTSQLIVQHINPLYFWVQVQEHCDNVNKLKQLLKKFTNEQLNDDFYKNRRGKYALLIYQAIIDNPKIEKEASSLLQFVINKLDAMGLDASLADTSILNLKKRAWYRYTAAVSYGFKAIEEWKSNHSEQAVVCLERAAKYSPDLTDNIVSNVYTRMEMNIFFNKPKTTFKDDYFNYLVRHNSDKNKALEVITDLAIVDYNFKNTAQTFYNIYFSDAGTFNDYWVTSFNKYANKSEPFKLKTIDGLNFSTVENKAKWIFIDFWGTWCGSCRYEHPALEKFYKKIQSSYSDKLSIITVACQDEENKVRDYMKNNKYSFPVAMADTIIENNFKVSNFPTKVLISPQGKYIVIPHNTDFVNLVKQYANL